MLAVWLTKPCAAVRGKQAGSDTDQTNTVLVSNEESTVCANTSVCKRQSSFVYQSATKRWEATVLSEDRHNAMSFHHRTVLPGAIATQSSRHTQRSTPA